MWDPAWIKLGDPASAGLLPAKRWLIMQGGVQGSVRNLLLSNMGLGGPLPACLVSSPSLASLSVGGCPSLGAWACTGLEHWTQA